MGPIVRSFAAAVLAAAGAFTGARAQSAPAGPAPVTAPEPFDSSELHGIHRSELARFDAMVRGDTTALRRYLADELEYTHSNGLVENKAIHLAGIATGQIVYRSLVPSEFSYRMYGPVVVGTGNLQSRGLLGGTPFAVALRVSTVHVWRDGRWQLVLSQSTRAP